MREYHLHLSEAQMREIEERRPCEQVIRVIRLLAQDPERLQQLVEDAKLTYNVVSEPQYKMMSGGGFMATIRVK